MRPAIVGPMSTAATGSDDARTITSLASPASAHADPVLTVPPRRRAVDWRIRFAVLSAVWGFSFLLIKVGTGAFAPFQVTFGRLLFGTAVLAVAMAVRRERPPRGLRTWG